MKTLLLLFPLLASLISYSQKSIADFQLPDVVSGRPVALSGFANRKGVVLIFTGNECPFDSYYRERLHALVEKYNGNFGFLFINSYEEPAENLDAMKVECATWRTPVPYLADKEQVVLMAFEVRKSPEVVVLKPTGGKFVAVYQGAIDDSPQVAESVTTSYLADAIEAVISGGTPPASVRAIGCTIRRK